MFANELMKTKQKCFIFLQLSVLYQKFNCLISDSKALKNFNNNVLKMILPFK